MLLLLQCIKFATNDLRFTFDSCLFAGLTIFHFDHPEIMLKRLFCAWKDGLVVNRNYVLLLKGTGFGFQHPHCSLQQSIMST